VFEISLFTFINGVFRIFELLIFADIVISWVMPHSNSPMVQIIRSITEPLLIPGRRLQQRFSPNLPIDFSPFIAIIILGMARSLVLSVFLGF
jgi:YggT family protein